MDKAKEVSTGLLTTCKILKMYYIMKVYESIFIRCNSNLYRPHGKLNIHNVCFYLDLIKLIP